MAANQHLDKERHREQVRAGNAAYYAAERRLIKAHPEEFEEYVVEELAARGIQRKGPNARTRSQDGGESGG
jgi:hypothetical protein